MINRELTEKVLEDIERYRQSLERMNILFEQFDNGLTKLNRDFDELKEML